jgi:hypothetical protein
MERPSTFGVCDPKDDIAFMTAYVICKGDIEAYERYIEKLKSGSVEDDDGG